MAGWQAKRCYIEQKDRCNNGRKRCQQWKKEMPLVKLKHAASHSRRTETTGNEVYCGKFVMEEYYIVLCIKRGKGRSTTKTRDTLYEYFGCQ
jgi:hypothetical protein